MKKNKKICLLLLILMILFVAKTIAGAIIKPPHHSDFTNIKVFYNNANEGDTITLFCYSNLLSDKPHNTIDKSKKINSVVQKDRTCFFKVPVKSANRYGYCYVTITRRNDTLHHSNSEVLLNPLLIERGDDFSLQIQQKSNLKSVTAFGNATYDFEGRSGAKYKLINSLDSIMNVFGGKGTSGFSLFDADNAFDHKINSALKFLDQNRKRIDVGFYDRIKADVYYGNWKYVRNSYLRSFYESLIKQKDTVNQLKFFEEYKRLNAREQSDLPESVLFESKEYIDYCRRKEYFNCLIKYGKINLEKIYYAIKNDFRGQIRDKLIFSYFYWLNDNGSLIHYSDIFNDAFKTVENKFYSSHLMLFNNRIAGGLAYDFALPDTLGKIIKLTDFRGKVVFIDFWYTGCGHCTDYYSSSLSQTETYFKNNPNIIFVTISIDKQFESWKKSIRSGIYTSPDIVNLFTAGMGIQHPIISYYNITGYPNPMIISKEGKIIKNDDTLRKKDILIATIEKAMSSK